MITLIRKLFQKIWQVIDVILYLAGLITISAGAFYINKPTGYIVSGIAFLISGYLTEVIANGEKGGDK